MVRSASRVPAVAVLGAAGCAIYGQLQGSAFVAPRYGAPSNRLESPVTLAASKAEIAEAQKQAKLLTWAYETAVAKGMPQAAMMKSKADQAIAAVEALKAQAEGRPAPPVSMAAAPVAAAPVAAARAMAAAPAAAGSASKAEIAEAEKQAKLLTWAYETAVAKGMPQAAAAKARADQAVAKWQALKAGAGAPSVSMAAAPVAAAPVMSAAPTAAGGASKAEIAEAEKQAKLLTWAYETAAAKGMPQAAAAKARADQAVAKWRALKDGAAAPSIPMAAAPAAAAAPVAAAAPFAAAPAAAPVAAGGASKAEIAEAEKQAKLLTWAYETAVAKGMPQAAMMKSKADQAVAKVEAMKAGANRMSAR